MKEGLAFGTSWHGTRLSYPKSSGTFRLRRIHFGSVEFIQSFLAAKIFGKFHLVRKNSAYSATFMEFATLLLRPVKGILPKGRLSSKLGSKVRVWLMLMIFLGWNGRSFIGTKLFGVAMSPRGSRILFGLPFTKAKDGRPPHLLGSTSSLFPLPRT